MFERLTLFRLMKVLAANCTSSTPVFRSRRTGDRGASAGGMPPAKSGAGGPPPVPLRPPMGTWRLSSAAVAAPGGGAGSDGPASAPSAIPPSGIADPPPLPPPLPTMDVTTSDPPPCWPPLPSETGAPLAPANALPDVSDTADVDTLAYSAPPESRRARCTRSSSSWLRAMTSSSPSTAVDGEGHTAAPDSLTLDSPPYSIIPPGCAALMSMCSSNTNDRRPARRSSDGPSAITGAAPSGTTARVALDSPAKRWW